MSTRNPSSRLTLALAALVFALALPAAAATAPAPVVFPVAAPAPAPGPCILPIAVTPNGNTIEPGDTFTTDADYNWVHSGDHLQGTLSTEKWAWGFFRPTFGSGAFVFNGFRTVVVVNNPDPLNPINVAIFYRSMAGAVVGTSFVNIPAEGTHTELATPLGLSTGNNGMGSIQVVSTDGFPFLASTVHHSHRWNGVLDFEPRAPFDAQHPGLASLQQAQDPGNGNPVLNGGPYPTISDGTASHVALAGLLPTFQVINPNNAATTVDLFFFGSLSGTFVGPVTINIPAFGSYIDLNFINTFFNAGTNAYVAGINDDWLVQAVSRDGLPLLGEQLALDFYDNALTPFARFRMASSMMSTRLGTIVHDPELTYTFASPPVHTITMIANFSSQNIGPVVIEYRDARTGTFATDTIAAFPPGATQRIAPTEPGILNYPTPVWDGNMRIRSCQPGLVGWTMREVEPDPNPGHQQFRKLYGESLDGTNINEPGAGFAVNTLGLNLTRKVAAIERCSPPFAFPPFWPSYTTFANLGLTGNVGSYFYQFFGFAGGNVTDFTLQPPPVGFAGVRWGENSFTFEDGVNRTCLPPFTMEVSGRVDHTMGTIVGIDVIGDPLYEWNLGIPEPPDPPVYEGPGDVVPTDATGSGGGDGTEP